MKKFWIILAAVGLFMAFTMPAVAAVGGVDVQFEGSYRVRGWYDDNVGNYSATTSASSPPGRGALLKANEPGGMGAGTVNRGQAFYDNRLRLQTTFKVAEGLKLVTRFDALEKKWGQDLNYAGQTTNYNKNDNINLERTFVSVTTGLGTFNVGYQDWGRFGTQLADSDESWPGIKYINTFGPLTVLVGTEKRSETQTRSGGTAFAMTGNQPYNAGYMDIDTDLYLAGGIFKFKGGEAGLLYEFYNARSNSQDPTQTTYAYRRQAHLWDAYAKYKVGPVYVEAEGILVTGGMWTDYTKLPSAGNGASIQNAALETWAFYLNAEVDLKPFYVGLKYVYATGDDANTSNKVEGGTLGALALGTDHDFALMLGNYEFFNQITGGAGWTPKAGAGTPTVNYNMDNISAIQLYFGWKPTPKLDVRLALTDAYSACGANQLDANGGTGGAGAVRMVSDHIGSEVDLRSTYRIFDNLSYSLNFGYFFTGDYFKGQSQDSVTSNDYLIMHQLLLSF